MTVDLADLAVAIRASPRDDGHDVCLYFVHEPVHDCIKIGVTSDPRPRIRNLQVNNPGALVTLGLFRVNPSAERDAHHKFSHLRARGEWFRSDPSLMRHIRALSCFEDLAW